MTDVNKNIVQRTIVSCSGKFHAFALAEQLQKHGMLSGFYTTYAWQKNRFMRRFARRLDKEKIDASLIHTNIPLAILIKSIRQEYIFNEWFDRWVAWSISRRNDYDIFIGWSGMSLHSISVAKRNGKTTILRRGSTHILFQNNILKEEYKKFGIKYSIDPRVIEKEIKEYELCDIISVPSTFARQSYIEYGIKPEKVVLNPGGVSSHFQNRIQSPKDPIVRLVYLGALTIQKGLVYLFEALRNLDIPLEKYEMWFIGSISDEMNNSIEKYRMPNWKFLGHVPHYDLQELLSQCDIGIMPSIQDGFGMVIPQMLSCGVTVVATTNTGAADIIREGTTGFIIPIRSSKAIADKIYYLFQNPEILSQMKAKATESIGEGFTWDDFGDRQVAFMNNLK